MAKKSAQTLRAKPRGEKLALLVIDAQNGLFHKSTPVYQAERLLANIRALAGRAAGAPVIYLQHSDARSLVEGTGDFAIHPLVQPAPGDLVIVKHHPSGFAGTDLEQALEARGVGELAVTGLVTHGCVRYTCQDALLLGYRVVLVSDGHSNFHRQPEPLIAETHAKLAAEGVELVPAAEVVFCG